MKSFSLGCYKRRLLRLLRATRQFLDRRFEFCEEIAGPERRRDRRDVPRDRLRPVGGCRFAACCGGRLGGKSRSLRLCACTTAKPPDLRKITGRFSASCFARSPPSLPSVRIRSRYRASASSMRPPRCVVSLFAFVLTATPTSKK
jgi:hypothetical protein